jgi:glycosyltransferase involved in cell wall biosynthesis
MRYIFVIKSFAQVAGVERVMADKMNYLAVSGHQILLVTYEQGNHPLIFELHPSINHIDLNCRFFTLHRQPIIKRLLESILMKRQFHKQIKTIIDDFKPNAIISPTYPLDVIGELASAKGQARLIFESHMAYVQALKEYSKPRSSFGALCAKLFDKRVIRLLQGCDCLVVLTQGDRDFWSHYVTNVRVLPNPLTSFPDIINDVPKDSYRIISIGRLTSIKRFDRLIDAFAIICNDYPDWHIDIFGEGSDEELLNSQITKLHLKERIHIHPPTNDIYTEMKKSQFLAMTSESEGFPLVLIEAMACGIPCLAFDCPYGPGEIIEHNKTGLLVTNGDTSDFANKMRYLIESPSIINDMGRNARLSASKFKKETVMKEWEKLYNGASQI